MEINIGCAPDWVKSSEVIDSLDALCKMWWTIGNKPILIMGLLIHYNICTKTKCISFSQISWYRFGKHFWLFGQISCALSNNAYFLQSTRLWALWTIWTAHNNKVFHENQLHEVSFFKQSVGNLYLIVCNSETSHCKFIIFTLCASKLFNNKSVTKKKNGKNQCFHLQALASSKGL